MKRVIVALLLLFVVVVPIPKVEAQAGGACPGIGTVTPMGYEAITVSSTAVGFTATVIVTSSRSAVVAECFIVTDAIRYRDDGTAPTAAIGMPVAVSTPFQVCGQLAVRNLRMIRQTTDATAHCSYYGG